MSSEESLFYDYFQTHFHELFQECVNSQYIFCLPPNLQMKAVINNFGDKFNTRKMNFFVNCHLLKTSPYFTDQFETNTEPKRTLVRKKNDLTTEKGYNKKFSASITKEDTFYNKDFKPYKIWYIDKCLVNGYIDIEKKAKRFRKLKNSVYRDRRKSYVLSSLSEMENYLKKVDRKVYESIKKQIVSFNKSYILLRGFEKQAIEKLNQYYLLLVKMYGSREVTVNMKLSIHSVLESGVHGKLFNFLRKCYRKKDHAHLKEYAYLKNKKLREFGVLDNFCKCKFDKSVNYLREIPKYTNTIEKMNCVKRALDGIRNEIYRIQQNEKRVRKKKNSFVKNNGEKNKVDLLTTDEIIPILCHVLVKAQIKELESNLQFMNLCQIDELQTTEYGFNLVSLNATVKFMEKEAGLEKEKIKRKKELMKSKSWDNLENSSFNYTI